MELSFLLFVLGSFSPAAAILASNFSTPSTNISTSTNAAANILQPLQAFMDASWPGTSQNRVSVHPPLTNIQASNGTVCPYAHAQEVHPTSVTQNVNTTVIKSRQGAVTVMVVGDSISQGQEGDWTWRYRIWEWFQSEGVEVNFVGPWVGTRPLSPPEPPSPPPLQDAPIESSVTQVTTGGYAAAAGTFDSDHCSAWGRQLAEAADLIGAQVAAYQPDYLLVELGFNDVGWFISDAEGTFESLLTFINEARNAKPDINLAIANIPQRSYIDGREDLPIKTDVYNQILASAISWLNISESQVALVEFRENYDCDVGGCPAGHDGLHPNALGEFQIAYAFSLALVNSFGIGSSALQIPAAADIPVRPNALPSNFQAVSSPTGITVTWDAPYGARNFDLQYNLEGQGWESLTGISTTRYDTGWVEQGWSYEFMIRTNNGDDAYDTITDWSAAVSAVCEPQTPPAPTDIVLTPTATGFNIAWTPLANDTDVTEWSIIFLGIYYCYLNSPAKPLNPNTTISGSWISGVGIEADRVSAVIENLVPGHNYIVAIQAWNQYGGGFPGVAGNVVVAAGNPPTPTNLQVTSLDSTTVQLDWCGSPDTAGYELWNRDINTAGSVFKAVTGSNTSSTTAQDGWLFPGVWNYEFAVSALNGDLSSGVSTGVVSPQPGFVAGGPVGGADCYSPGTVTSSWGDPTPACTSGTGPGNYANLCVFTCDLGFCPGPCTCNSEGPQTTLPDSTGTVGYPLAGEDDSYAALCSFACNLGYCPTSACSTSPSGSDSSGGNGNGSATGVIFVPSGLSNIGCDGDCTFVLPPSPLPEAETITWPHLTTTLLSSATDGTIYTITTIISIPVFTITEVSYWAVTVESGDPTTATFVAEQSIMPPALVLNLPGNEVTFPVSSPSSYSDFQPVPTSSTTTPVPVFFPGSYQLTIQPQPTILISTPSPTTYTYSSTSNVASQSTCTSHCGSHDCTIFGCGHYCGFFGCGGGCGIFGCGGGCGILGCGGGCLLPGGCGSTSCPLGIIGCSNPGCLDGGCPGPGPGIGDTNGDGDDNPTSTRETSTKTCSTSTTIAMCDAFCSVTDYISTTATACGSTTCTKTITACSVTGTTSTELSTMTVFCDISEPYTPWWTDTDELLPTLGVNDSGGYLESSGTWTAPSYVNVTVTSSLPASASSTTQLPTASTQPPTKTSATTVAPTSTPSNTFDIFSWTVMGEQGNVFYAAGLAASDWCASSFNQITNDDGDPVTIPPSEGDFFTVCGVKNLVGGATTGGGFAVSTVDDSNIEGTCVEAAGAATSSCTDDGLEYTVALVDTCNLVICP